MIKYLCMLDYGGSKPSNIDSNHEMTVHAIENLIKAKFECKLSPLLKLSNLDSKYIAI